MKLGTNTINSVKLGSNQVNAVYLGSNLVWQNAPVATAATGVGQTSFTANWNAYTGAVYYLLDVSLSSSFSTFVLENQIVLTNSYAVTGLSSNTTYYYRVRASTEYDTDYQSILNYATTQGYTLPSASQRILQNQLVIDLKAAGVWSRLESFGVFATDGDEDFALIDWINLSQYTAVNSPGFTTNQGFRGDGVSKYINFNYVWGSSISSSNASLGQYYYSGTITVNDIMGSRIAFTDSMSMLRPSNFRLFCDDISSVYSPQLGIDIHVRNGANSGYVRNGSTNYTVSSLVNQNKNTLSNYGLSAINTNGSANFFGLTNEIPISMSFFGQSFTTTQAANFDSSFSTYISSL